MDNCHHYYVKQKHEINFKTGLRNPNVGNLVTGGENCDVKIPFCSAAHITFRTLPY